jgi:uncharacterized protein
VRQQESGNLSFKEAFEQSFREVFGRLSDQAAALAIRALGADQSRFVQVLKTDLEGQLGKDAISLDHALRLIRDYQVEDAYHTIAPLITSLVAEDDARRYDIQENVPVKTPGRWSRLCTNSATTERLGKTASVAGIHHLCQC